MQEVVGTFIKKYQLSGGISIRYIDLVSEVGELGKEILKYSDYGKSVKTEFDQWEPGEDTKMEMGDCLFSLFALCCEMNINAKEALEKALEKYELRFERKGRIGSEN